MEFISSLIFCCMCSLLSSEVLDGVRIDTCGLLKYYLDYFLPRYIWTLKVTSIHPRFYSRSLLRATQVDLPGQGLWSKACTQRSIPTQRSFTKIGLGFISIGLLEFLGYPSGGTVRLNRLSPGRYQNSLPRYKNCHFPSTLDVRNTLQILSRGLDRCSFNIHPCRSSLGSFRPPNNSDLMLNFGMWRVVCPRCSC